MITDIPIEVLNEILSHIPAFDPNKGDLLSCCLVNKFFHSIATPALYRNLELATSSQGFEEHVILSLLSKRHKSHNFIRQISIAHRRDFYRRGFVSLYNRERAAIHIAAFIASLREEQLQSISCDTLDTLQYIPSPYYSKIKSIVSDFEGGRIVGKPFFQTLKTLTFHDISPYFSNFGVEWSICKQHQQNLKSLFLNCGLGENNNFIRTPFPYNPYIEFRSLEHFHVQGMQSLDLGKLSLLGLIPAGIIRRLELIDCYIPPSYLIPLIPNFTSVTDLAVYSRFNVEDETYTGSDIDDILLKLPSLLQSLQWTFYSTAPSEYPSKKAIQRHSGTLKKLWLEISYLGGSQAPPSWERSHYSDENRFKMLRVFIKSKLDEAVDLDTLSQFPHLEHLAVPIETPVNPNSWISSFPKLRSLYLVNSCKVYCSKPRSPTNCFRQEWIDWFMSAYNLESYDNDDHPNHSRSTYERHPNLQLVAFQRPAYNWEHRLGNGAPQPGSRGFTAHLRDADRSGYFSKEAITSETVRSLYPEAWELFKGYYMSENKQYVLPSENTNLAKGVFEDQDENMNLPDAISTLGGHALQDYQMQLMLLEQQNKKRLMSARAEQDALRECPIEEPEAVVVTIPPWGIPRNPESENYQDGYTSVFNPRYGNNDENHSFANPEASSSAPPKSLQEYQKDFLVFHAQMKMRREYAAAHMEKYMNSVPTPQLGCASRS
ncbi:hypothetical protein TWF506_008147 [Arthrobotrys conoides]|uniref:F-box domain-containing protein n=1 Tax=Arthrobotrys conoides TaxID=74498 RepID=A0AAN8RXY7_9PEZI